MSPRRTTSHGKIFLVTAGFLSLWILFIFFAVSLTGCVSAPARTTMSPEQGAAIERVTVSSAATLILAKNPKDLPVAEALQVGIDAAIAATSTITPEQISDYIKTVCAQHDVSREDTAVFINLGQTLYQTYVDIYRPQVVSSTDPRVLLYVRAFRDGLGDAVAAVKKAGS